MSEPFLSIRNLEKSYPGRSGSPHVTIFDEVSFDVAQGEFVSIIGHSGCGKSTILSIVAGLAQASSGSVAIEGAAVTRPGLSRGVVFQNHSLMPWLSALRNVAFAVRARHPDWPKPRVLEHSRRFLRLVGLHDAEHKRPSQLSGGMRQRVGIARAFAIEPKILLMDEPFGALDALTRASIQDELVELWKGTHQTIIMITHDVDEAIYLSDRILVMSDGPNARISEIVTVDFERPRERSRLFQDPRYHQLRAHLLDFLTRGARSAQAVTSDGAPPASGDTALTKSSQTAA